MIFEDVKFDKVYTLQTFSKFRIRINKKIMRADTRIRLSEFIKYIRTNSSAKKGQQLIVFEEVRFD